MIVRQALPEDAGAMAAIVNDIIAIGGTTAHESPILPGNMRHDYIDGPDVIAAVVVEMEGEVIGWQSVGWWQGQADIGTFVQPGLQAQGAGVAMFGLTADLVAKAGVAAITAAIRADNLPGLAYYRKLGFVDVGADPGFALKDGRVVGRVYRRFDLV
jgi:L-amino acid N-acyltransferase YncA